MAVPECIVKEQWVGNNTLSNYTFDFTIQDLQHILVIVQNLAGDEYFRGRGDDFTFLSAVVFDSKLGGGTIYLKDVLPNGWILTALQANDAPTQPSEFKDKFSFTLERFELALDYLITAIQRVAYLAQRSVKIHDLDDSFDFDPTLKKGIGDNPRATVIINAAGDGFDYGPTADDIIIAKEYAIEAAASASAAAASEHNATTEATAAAASAASAAASALSAATDSGSAAAAQATAAAAAATAAANAATTAANSATAAAAAASASASAAILANALTYAGPFAAIAPNANANLLGEITDHTVYTQVDYIARIKRGTTVFARQEFSIFYRNGAWEIALSGDRYADAGADHGVTFTVSGTGQINAAVANDGGSNAVIDIFKTSWPV